jgi:hypothetical protein
MKLGKIALSLILMLVVVSCGGPTSTPAAVSTDTPASIESPTPAIPTDTLTPAGPLGSISGQIAPVAANSGPTGTLRVYAREVNTLAINYVEVPDGQTNYVISGLPVGVYEVIGWIYPDGVTGAYTSAGISTAQTSADQLTCDNSILQITIKPSKLDFQGADIGCWAGDFFMLLTPMP